MCLRRSRLPGSYVRRTGYSANGAEAIAWGAHTSLCPERVTAEDVLPRGVEGDAVAYSITKQVGRYLAQAIQQLIMHYDIER